jgi:hypothetical protein
MDIVSPGSIVSESVQNAPIGPVSERQILFRRLPAWQTGVMTALQAQKTYPRQEGPG